MDIRYPIDPDRAGALVRASLIGAGERVVERELGPGRVMSSRDVRLGPDVPVVCVIGAFDGLHEGHRSLVRAARSDAAERGLPCVAVTFSPDPAEVLRGPEASSTLLDSRSRALGLLRLGVDAVLVLPFTAALAAMDQRPFVERVLLSSLRPVSVHVGENFSFGRGGAGDPESLAALGAEAGFSVRAHELLALDGGPVSATRIRALLHEGRLDEATRLLGRCHYVRGDVRHGRGEGRTFGFPTANVTCDLRDCMPREGVYACYCVVGRTAWPAAVNVGAPPTFSAHEDAFLEANLIGFSGDLYGRDCEVVFVRWLRASRRFDSTAELERVVLSNIGWVKENLGSRRVEVALDT